MQTAAIAASKGQRADQAEGEQESLMTKFYLAEAFTEAGVSSGGQACESCNARR
jgi:hypothetical protein